MEKKFIQDKEGVQVLPITHISAVRDDGGNTLDSILANDEQDIQNLLSRIVTSDEEDITTINNNGTKILKFKDKNNLDGMGKIILRKNKTFAEQLTQTNTIYIIRYDFTLTDDVTIPTNCVLEFDGGSISGAHTLTGNNTGIQAGLVKIFNTDMTLAGSWNVAEAYPEWFGAKGDGVTDDTTSIKKMFGVTGFDSCVFNNKIYIINMPQLSNPSTPTAIFDPVRASHIIGYGNATLKLGSGNCNAATGTGFAAILYISGKRNVTIENITFDYNYENNVPYQRGGTSVIVENNGQQLAIQFANLTNAIVRNCTFIEASGNNVIVFWSNKTYDSLFVCENNKFIDFGYTSKYNDNGTIVDALHDVSVISSHFSTSQTGAPSGKHTTIIRNNIANGVGGNAYDFCEVHAHNFIFTGNKITDFATGVMPLCDIAEEDALIENNTFINCICGIHFWNTEEDNCGLGSVSGSYGYRNLTINNNNIIVNFKKWFETPLYNTLDHVDSNNYYYNDSASYGAISQAGQGNKNIKNLTITNNNIEYINTDIPNSYFKINYFGVINIFSTPSRNEDSSIDKLIVTDNIFKGAPNEIWRNNGYNNFELFDFSRNIIINQYTNPNHNNRAEGILGIPTYADGVTYFHKIRTLVIMDNIINIDTLHISSETYTACIARVFNSQQNSIAIVKNNTVYGEKYNQTVELGAFALIDRSCERTYNENRPTLSTNDVGYQYFDTTLGKPIFWNGAAWVDATGATV